VGCERNPAPTKSAPAPAQTKAEPTRLNCAASPSYMYMYLGPDIVRFGTSLYSATE
jgi:hypothetical protein